MRRVKLIALAVALAVPAAASAEGRGKIVVTVTGFKSDSGWMRISLFSSKKGFPGKHALAVSSGSRPIKNRTSSFVFDGVPHGTYAIAVLHDANSNGKMDTNFIGIPKEGGGTSRDAKARFGPPSYDDAKFVLQESALRLQIRMQYP
jgi:uncharacterized protein (DUF2141 family)